MALRAAWICAVVAMLNWFDTTNIGLAQDNLGFVRRVSPVVESSETDLPDEAKEILNSYESEAQEIRRKAEKEISLRREVVIKTLQELQDKYTREAKLDEAVAIRDKLRLLRVAHLKPRRNPGTLVNFGNRIGQTFYFDVVGNGRGAVWGADVYTSDSTLAAAAVHAGVLKAGQRGIVKVKILESPEHYFSSTKNDVTTMEFGQFMAAYTVERPLPTDVDTSEPANEPAAGATGINPGF